MANVCTGALVHADAGLLDGRPATTYWSAFDELLPLGHDVSARPDERFVDDGEVITATGVSAGIDMALSTLSVVSARRRRAREVAAGDAQIRASSLGLLRLPSIT